MQFFFNPFAKKGTGPGPQNIQIYVCPSSDSTCNREEKSLHHIAMVAKFPDDKQIKSHLKSEFALFETSVILFNLSSVGKIFWVKSERTVSRRRK